jgi:hypothetical protein|eukprot:SAG25_NODE_729_length_5691_cov_223.244234_8_plen_75_part_00
MPHPCLECTEHSPVERRVGSNVPLPWSVLADGHRTVHRAMPCEDNDRRCRSIDRREVPQEERVLLRARMIVVLG